MFPKHSWCVKFDMAERNLLLIIHLYSCFLYIAQVLPTIFPLKWFYSEIFFSYFVLSYCTVLSYQMFCVEVQSYHIMHIIAEYWIKNNGRLNSNKQKTLNISPSWVTLGPDSFFYYLCENRLPVEGCSEIWKKIIIYPGNARCQNISSHCVYLILV